MRPLAGRRDPLHDPSVIVMKFGGTSLGGAAAIRQAVEVVAAQAQRRPVVVVSAHEGITDSLLETSRSPEQAVAVVEDVITRHREVLRGLGLPHALLDTLFAELLDVARGLQLVGEASPKAIDAIASYGERLSARVFAAALGQAGVPAAPVDAFDAGLRTDSTFGRARPVADDGRIHRHLDAIDGVPVVTGYVGADDAGNITTLGRNGSDFSAAWIGAAVGAAEVQIWTDVDGVHTADPRAVPSARSIPTMSFADLADLAAFGSEVLHPAAMVPLRQSGIPLRVRSTLAPGAAGTTVQPEAAAGQPVVRAIAHLGEVGLVTVRSQRLVPQHTFLSEVFCDLDGLGCDVGPVTVREAAVTVVVADGDVERAAAAIAGHGEVDIVSDRAVVGVIGDAALTDHGGIDGVLATLKRGGVEAACAGLVTVGNAVAFSVAARQLRATLELLHDLFFSSRP